jgi:hypothetical protein
MASYERKKKMAVFKTLKDLQTKTSKPAPSAEGERVNRFYVKMSREAYKIRFRQELTEDASGFDSEAGTAELVLVHTNPNDFRKSARCTGEDENYGYTCWACKQVLNNEYENAKQWKARPHLLINVAVLNEETKEWEPRVLDQKFTPAHIVDSLVEFAGEYETITDRDYKISRKGEKQTTEYNLVPLSVKAADKKIADLPMHDLSKVYRSLSPSEQEAFYVASEDGSTAKGWG